MEVLVCLTETGIKKIEKLGYHARATSYAKIYEISNALGEFW
jgi:hypothetical protein